MVVIGVRFRIDITTWVMLHTTHHELNEICKTHIRILRSCTFSGEATAAARCRTTCASVKLYVSIFHLSG
jgi:hypothetical protein